MIELTAKLEDLIALPDEECATALNARARYWDEVDQVQPLSYGERGLIAVTFERRRLWEYIDGCHSFDSWMSHRPDASRSTMYAAWRAAKELENDVPDLSGIPRDTVETLRGISSSVRREPEVIEAAKTKTPAEFVEHIQENHPNQHIERRKPLKFNFSESQSKVIEQGIKFATDNLGARSREEAMEMAMAEAMEQWPFDVAAERRMAEILETIQ